MSVLHSHIPRCYVIDNPGLPTRHQMVCSCGQFGFLSEDGVERLGREFDKHLQPFIDGEKMTVAKVIASAIGIPVFPMKPAGLDHWPGGIYDEDVIGAAEKVLEWHEAKLRS